MDIAATKLVINQFRNQLTLTLDNPSSVKGQVKQISLIQKQLKVIKKEINLAVKQINKNASQSTHLFSMGLG
ncbi:MAG: hypothetical protein FWJ34_17450, partial [Geminocystis sp. GBBB08]|nr:hypothetical protein [Geminocystis sp. GBBB08]